MNFYLKVLGHLTASILNEKDENVSQVYENLESLFKNGKIRTRTPQKELNASRLKTKFESFNPFEEYILGDKFKFNFTGE